MLVKGAGKQQLGKARFEWPVLTVPGTDLTTACTSAQVGLLECPVNICTTCFLMACLTQEAKYAFIYISKSEG